MMLNKHVCDHLVIHISGKSETLTSTLCTPFQQQ